ncbi:MAG: HEAT repeat domain-containing protein, partial [Candidatus Helarchaeales archaeon]
MNSKDLLDRLEKANKIELSVLLDEIGELKSKEAVEPLIDFMNAHLDDPDLIDAVIWTLNRISPIERLFALLKHSNKNVVANVIDALGRRADKTALPHLLPFLKEDDASLRSGATWAIGKMKDPKSRQALLTRLREDEDPEIRAHAAWGLGQLCIPDLLPLLEQIREKETDDAVVYQLDEALQKIKSESFTSQIKKPVFSYGCKKFTVECLLKDIKKE